MGENPPYSGRLAMRPAVFLAAWTRVPGDRASSGVAKSPVVDAAPNSVMRPARSFTPDHLPARNGCSSAVAQALAGLRDQGVEIVPLISGPRRASCSDATCRASSWLDQQAGGECASRRCTTDILRISATSEHLMTPALRCRFRRHACGDPGGLLINDCLVRPPDQPQPAARAGLVSAAWRTRTWGGPPPGADNGPGSCAPSLFTALHAGA